MNDLGTSWQAATESRKDNNQSQSQTKKTIKTEHELFLTELNTESRTCFVCCVKVRKTKNFCDCERMFCSVLSARTRVCVCVLLLSLLLSHRKRCSKELQPITLATESISIVVLEVVISWYPSRYVTCHRVSHGSVLFLVEQIKRIIPEGVVVPSAQYPHLEAAFT